MNDDGRLDIIKHSHNIICVKYVQLDDFWRTNSTQSSPDRFPAIQQKLSLYLSTKQSTCLMLESASMLTAVVISLPPVINAVCVMVYSMKQVTIESRISRNQHKVQRFYSQDLKMMGCGWGISAPHDNASDRGIPATPPTCANATARLSRSCRPDVLHNHLTNKMSTIVEGSAQSSYR